MNPLIKSYYNVSIAKHFKIKILVLLQDVLKKIQNLVGVDKRPVRFGTWDVKEVCTSFSL